MTPNQGAAYIMAQAALLNAKIAAAQAANTNEEYRSHELDALVKEFEGILGINSVLTIFEGCHEA